MSSQNSSDFTFSPWTLKAALAAKQRKLILAGESHLGKQQCWGEGRDFHALGSEGWRAQS